MDRLYKYLFLIVTLALLGVIGAAWYRDRQAQATAQNLRNEIAAKAETIEIQQGLYSKLSLESKNLIDLLSSKDDEVVKLRDELKKSKDDILSVTSLVLKWKSAYQSVANATQTEIPASGPAGIRLRVDFDKDFGPFVVKGYSLTNPAYAWLEVTQGRPLRLSLAITQQKDRSWRTIVASSEENMDVDVAVTAVNPYVLEERWYEKLSFDGTLAFGSTPNGLGLLMGLGASYKFSSVSVGPAVFVGVSSGLSLYGGFNVKWFPFERNK